MIVMGLLTGSLGTFVFGFAPNFWIALAARLIAGKKTFKQKTNK